MRSGDGSKRVRLPLDLHRRPSTCSYGRLWGPFSGPPVAFQGFYAWRPRRDRLDELVTTTSGSVAFAGY